MSVASLPFPLVGVNIGLLVNAANLQDVNTHWISQATGPIGFLSAAIGDQDTALTFQGPILFPQPTVAMLALGITVIPTAVLIDNEPMSLVTVPTGPTDTVTVVRAATAFAFLQGLMHPPITAHAAGAPVMLLNYVTPWEMIAEEALRPWMRTVSEALGKYSATFGAVASGSVTVP